MINNIKNIDVLAANTKEDLDKFFYCILKWQGPVSGIEYNVTNDFHNEIVVLVKEKEFCYHLNMNPKEANSYIAKKCLFHGLDYSLVIRKL